MQIHCMLPKQYFVPGITDSNPVYVCLNGSALASRPRSRLCGIAVGVLHAAISTRVAMAMGIHAMVAMPL
jgi:hypothetical protein